MSEVRGAVDERLFRGDTTVSPHANLMLVFAFWAGSSSLCIAIQTLFIAIGPFEVSISSTQLGSSEFTGNRPHQP
jgi:hypothetical protein